MELTLLCTRIDENSDTFFINFKTTANKQIHGAEIKVRLAIDKEHITKFDPKRYKVGEEYKVDIDL
jgi:hypothetical protein